MKTIKCLLCTSISLIFINGSIALAQLSGLSMNINVNEAAINHTVSTTFEISETAINRFLQNQYSTGSIPPTSSGIIEGVTYSLNLELPEIILMQDAIKLRMAISIISSIGNYSVSIEPTMSIPSLNISLTEIDATFANLTNVVNALSLDSRLKTAIINHYNSLVIQIYPSKLLSQINTTSFSQNSIKVIDASLQANFQPSKLQFVMNIVIQSRPPTFLTGISYGSDGHNHIAFWASLKVHVKEIMINIIGSSTAFQTTLDVVVPKWEQEGDYVIIDIGDQGYRDYHTCIIKARFQTDDTWFSRTFSFVPVTWTWQPSTSSIN